MDKVAVGPEIKFDLYLINLNHRKDRKEKCLSTLQKYDFNIHIFNAIRETEGWKGCAKSHLTLIKHAKDNNMNYIIVAEDDVELLVNPQIVNDIITYLSSNTFALFNGSPTLWDVRNDIQSVHTNTIHGSPNLATINWGQTLSFVIYHKSIYDYMLDNYHFDEAIDQFTSLLVQQTIYVGPTPFCKQSESYSDIQNRKTTYGQLFHNDHKKILDILDKNTGPSVAIGVYGIFIGEYKCLYRDWIDNISKLFFPGSPKNFYVVTDDPQLPMYNNTTFIVLTEKIGWPYETLYRFKYFLQFKECDILASDIIYFVNANGRFVLPVSNDVLPNESGYVFTTHNGYDNKPYNCTTFEKKRLLRHMLVRCRHRSIMVEDFMAQRQ
jgi:hypothetical protein